MEPAPLRVLAGLDGLGQGVDCLQVTATVSSLLLSAGEEKQEAATLKENAFRFTTLGLSDLRKSMNIPFDVGV